MYTAPTVFDYLNLATPRCFCILIQSFEYLFHKTYNSKLFPFDVFFLKSVRDFSFLSQGVIFQIASTEEEMMIWNKNWLK